ncbi:MAG TPA: hypothetical protein RMH99_26390 [Sandaracinaceae bacterium LLY-WYZ-13_1]|nr:hypothetical protein [Sandaracinaceae bacterium LLY-WYZ-13_1]
MRLHASAACLVVLLGFAAPAAAQPVTLVVDAPEGSAIAPAELRAALAEATGRTILDLAHVDSAASPVTLVVAHEAADRWILRLARRGAVVQVTHRTPAATALEHLAAAAAALLRGFDDATAPGADLVDPFLRRAWDPLGRALDDQLHRPFPAGEPMTYLDVVDPFRPFQATGLVDPWAR